MTGRLIGLLADAERRHRDDDERPRTFELARDQRVELLARRDLRIPPDRPALRLDGRDEWRDASLVAAGIRNEDVSHSPYTCSRSTPGPPLRGSLTRSNGRNARLCVGDHRLELVRLDLGAVGHGLPRLRNAGTSHQPKAQ